MLNFIEYNKKNKYLSGIYCIINTIDDRIYIGSTKCFYKRFYEHNRDFCKNNHGNQHFQNFVNLPYEKNRNARGCRISGK